MFNVLNRTKLDTIIQ